MSDLNAAKALVRDWWATIDSAPVGELAQKAAQHLDGYDISERGKMRFSQ